MAAFDANMSAVLSPEPVIYSPVRARAEKVVIVAGGDSLRELDFNLFKEVASDGVHVIAVNGAVKWLPVVHSWFTLDPATRNRPLMAKQRPGVTYYAAVPADYGLPHARVAAHRRPAESGIVWLRRITGQGFCGARPALCEEPDGIHTGNSAWGALGLAWHLGAGRIALLGVDADDAGYAFQVGRPVMAFDHLPRLFSSATPQLYERGVEVMNGSPASRVDCFARSAPNDALSWLGE